MAFQIIPKIPALNLQETEDFYVQNLGFECINKYPDYLLLECKGQEIHFYLQAHLNVLQNSAMLYIRVGNEITDLYKESLAKKLPRPKGNILEIKPWGVEEFSLLDCNHTLLTFGRLLAV